jgi:serine/threonine protein kinase
MAREHRIGDQPVPGYRLAKFLGRGGIGEVWRAIGPGRTDVALKLIALDRKQGIKEFKSLRLVKRIHHPNLAPILAFWLIDAEGNPLDDDQIDLVGSNLLDGSRLRAGSASARQFDLSRAEQLVIAMGLGEKNLLDVLHEYQAKGVPGIPLDELLDYMEGSARAIDFLNTPRHDLGGPQPVAIQHCDIKPQNIMLVGDAVQVCDFGLARSLTDVRSTTVAASIAYGAPELYWQNKPTHATDQYSLAITYYELRTGHLPFNPDLPALEVMQAHRDGTLDFSGLGDAERAVIKRATNPSPAGRFDRTIDMVRSLQRAVQGGSAPLPETDYPAAASKPGSWVAGQTMIANKVTPGRITTTTVHSTSVTPDTRSDVRSTVDEKPLPVKPRGRRLPVFAVFVLLLALGAGGLLTGKQTEAKVDRLIADGRFQAALEESDSPPLWQSWRSNPLDLQQRVMSSAEKAVQGYSHRGEIDAALDVLAQLKPMLSVEQLDRLRKDFLHRAIGYANQKIDANQLAEARAAFQRLSESDSENQAVVELGKRLEESVPADTVVKVTPDDRDTALTSRTDLSPITDTMPSRDETVSERSDDKHPSRDPQISAALDKMIALLKSPDTQSAEIQKTLDELKLDGDHVPEPLLAKLADSFATRGRESNQTDSLDTAIAWIRSLKQTDDVRRAAVALEVEQVRRAASLPKIDWLQLEALCRTADKDMAAVRDTEHQGFVKACLAEALLESAEVSTNGFESQAEIETALKSAVSADDRFYLDYVMLRVSQATGRTLSREDRASLADTVCQAFKSPSALFANRERQARAAELLSGAARELITMDSSGELLRSPSFGDNKDLADQAYRWLKEAGELTDATGKKLDDNSRTELAIAAIEKNDPELVLAGSLLDELSKGPSPAPAGLLFLARSLVDSAPDAAVRRYADALQAALKLGTAKNEAIYDQIVAPAIGLAETLKQKRRESVAAQVAVLYAARGRLIQLDAAVESKVFAATQRAGADAVFEAYDQAIKQNPNMPDYYIERGMARFQTSLGGNDLETLVQDEIEPARALPGGSEALARQGLTAAVDLAQARSLRGRENRGRRIDLYRAAAAKAGLAAKTGVNEHRAPLNLLVSAANLELAGDTTEGDGRIQVYLNEAVAAAKQALADRRGASIQAGLALGRAEEAVGLLLADNGGYHRAVRAFNEARQKAPEYHYVPDEALVCLGRARYRLAVFGAVTASARETLLATGLADLQAAIDAQRLAPARLAEAYWWQSQIHFARMQKTPSERLAADTAVQQGLSCVDKASSQWLEYQLHAARLASEPKEQRNRARTVLDLPTSKADGFVRAEALSIIANSYRETNATAEQLRQQLGQGLAEYQRYLPWLPNVAKGQNSDVPVLLALAQLTLLDPGFWRANADLCKASAERAFALANQSGAVDLAARARDALGTHAVYVASISTTDSLAALRKAADHFKAAVLLDDKLDTAPLTAVERQNVRNRLAPLWRLALANIELEIANDSRTSAADRQKLKRDALAALDHAKVPDTYQARFDECRMKLNALR